MSQFLFLFRQVFRFTEKIVEFVRICLFKYFIITTVFCIQNYRNLTNSIFSKLLQSHYSHYTMTETLQFVWFFVNLVQCKKYREFVRFWRFQNFCIGEYTNYQALQIKIVKIKTLQIPYFLSKIIKPDQK
jgi:hypothetical protein